jgi:hypothetical protein
VIPLAGSQAVLAEHGTYGTDNRALQAIAKLSIIPTGEVDNDANAGSIPRARETREAGEGSGARHGRGHAGAAA